MMGFDPTDDARPRLLPGKSAAEWGLDVAKWVFATLGPLALVGVASALVAQPLRGAVLVILSVVEVVICVKFYLAWRSLRAALDRERQAGYTTWADGYPELWLLRPKTGEVVRPPKADSNRRRRR